MSDLIIECSKGKIKVIGHAVEAFGEGDDFFFQVKGFKWLENKKSWTKQARYHTFKGYDVVNGEGQNPSPKSMSV